MFQFLFSDQRALHAALLGPLRWKIGWASLACTRLCLVLTAERVPPCFLPSSSIFLSLSRFLLSCTPFFWRRKWQPTPVFLPGKSHGQRCLEGYSPWGHKESDMSECACMPFFEHNSKAFCVLQRMAVTKPTWTSDSRCSGKSPEVSLTKPQLQVSSMADLWRNGSSWQRCPGSDGTSPGPGFQYQGPRNL